MIASDERLGVLH